MPAHLPAAAWLSPPVTPPAAPRASTIRRIVRSVGGYASHAPSPCGPGLAVRWLLAPSRGRRTIRSYGVGARPRRARTVLRGACATPAADRQPRKPTAVPGRLRSRPAYPSPLAPRPPDPGGRARWSRSAPARRASHGALCAPRSPAFGRGRFAEGGLRARTRRARPLRVLITPPAPRSARGRLRYAAPEADPFPPARRIPAGRPGGKGLEWEADRRRCSMTRWFPMAGTPATDGFR